MPILCPPPPDKLPPLRLRTLPQDTRLFRVGSKNHDIDAWDGRDSADCRFSPLRVNGDVVPVSYTGTTPEVVLLETVLRYTPEGGGGYVPRSEYENRRIAELRTTRPLKLIQLLGPEARALGENVGIEISHAPAEQYSTTRAWAAKLFASFPKADGIEWISHQDGRESAFVIWRRKGTENSAPFRVIGGPVELTTEGVLHKLLRLAEITGHDVEIEQKE